MVETTSATDAPSRTMVAQIVLVRVARIFALTPLPRPSANTAMVESAVRTVTTLSPQSSSPFLLRLFHATSICTLIRNPPSSPRVVAGDHILELCQRDLRLRRCLAQKARDFLRDDHLLVDYLLRHVDRIHAQLLAFFL